MLRWIFRPTFLTLLFAGVLLPTFFAAKAAAQGRCESTFVTSESFVDEKLEKQIAEFLKSERGTARTFGAASRIRLHRDSQGRILKRPVVLMFHGLLNNPAFFHHFENRVYDSGSHVFNIRLPGHHETNARALDFATRDQWIQRSREAMVMASGLRAKVSLVGHSLGGLLSARLAKDFSFYVERVLLLAPSFDLSANTKRKVKVTTSVGLSGWILGRPEKAERYMSTWGGAEVNKLGDETVDRRDLSVPSIRARLAQLLKVPVLWVDTGNDSSIDLRTNGAVAAALATDNSDFKRVLIPRSEKLKHNQLGQFRHDFQSDLETTLLDFLSH